MSETKIEFKVGIVEFSGEGDPKWLSEQLDKILEKVPELLKLNINEPISSVNTPEVVKPNPNPQQQTNAPTNLSIYLKEKSATTNQSLKFLVTAIFLQLNGNKRLTTANVNNAIKDAQQSKLRNSSENLNQNVKKGFCEKDGSSFFVTQAGLDSLKIR